MALRPIIILPDSRLRQICAPVTHIDSAIETLIGDMLETMYEAPGIGLAACQIGVLHRVIVMDVADKEAVREPLAMINPEIVSASAEKGVYEEGCLSIPDIYGDVERPAQVWVRYRDRSGAVQEMDADGLLATCVQHEIDHLNGILFIDYLSRLRRERIIRKFEKAARRDNRPDED
jgi:peptide deformylase